MKAWLKRSCLKATPYLIYLIIFLFILMTNHILQSASTVTSGMITFLVVGSAPGAFIALWKLSLAFSPDIRIQEETPGFLDIPTIDREESFVQNLRNHCLQLRKIALSYERYRQNLTRIGVSIGLASLTVPIATWSVIFLDAFKKESVMPNAWLLVVSSTTAGFLGLSIAITLLKHLKSNQQPLSEISNRLLISVETLISTTSHSSSEEFKTSLVERAMNNFIQTPSSAHKTDDDKETAPSDQDNKIIERIITIFANKSGIHNHNN